MKLLFQPMTFDNLLSNHLSKLGLTKRGRMSSSHNDTKITTYLLSSYPQSSLDYTPPSPTTTNALHCFIELLSTIFYNVTIIYNDIAKNIKLFSLHVSLMVMWPFFSIMHLIYSLTSLVRHLFYTTPSILRHILARPNFSSKLPLLYNYGTQ